MSLQTVPMSLGEANELVATLHRHHQPVRFHLFSIGVRDANRTVGVAIVMRPANQHMAFDGFMCEVSRLATDGTKNACSFLLAKCARIAFEMGYLGIQTYTLPEEGGASLRAAGWVAMGETRGIGWSTPKRRRADTHPIGPKTRWWRLRSDMAKEIGHVQ